MCNVFVLHEMMKINEEKLLFFRPPNESNNLVYARRLDNLSYTRFLNGDSIGILEGFTKAFNIRKAKNDKPGKVISMFRLAQFHHKFNEPIKAIKFSESAKRLALDIFDYRNALSVIHFLSKIDRQLLYSLSLGTKMKDMPCEIPLSMAAIEKRKRVLKDIFEVETKADKDLISAAKEKGFI